ncbi:MAG: hypothetical protein ACOC15_03790 [Desulfovibrionales bacterium]
MTGQKKFLGEHLLLIGICLVFLIVLAVVLLIPTQKKIKELDRRIAREQGKVEEQKVLHPLYVQLTGELDRLESRDVTEPAQISISKEGISGLWDIFAELAGEAGLTTVTIQPVSKSLSDQLQVNAVFTGPLPAFRQFLLDLGGLAFVSHLEQMVAREVVGGREYRVTMWLKIT